MERVHISDGLLGDWAVNIEELKQVGEMLATLSGHAYNGFLIWIGKEYLDIILKWAVWFAFWFMGFKAVAQIVRAVVGNIDKETARSQREEEFIRIGQLLRESGRHAFPWGDPESVTKHVKQLIESKDGGKQ